MKDALAYFRYLILTQMSAEGEATAMGNFLMKQYTKSYLLINMTHFRSM